jgi:hypothetical protein
LWVMLGKSLGLTEDLAGMAVRNWLECRTVRHATTMSRRYMAWLDHRIRHCLKYRENGKSMLYSVVEARKEYASTLMSA